MQAPRKLILLLAGAAAVMMAFVRFGSYVVNYGVGRGFLELRWAFLGGLPLAAIACGLAVSIVAMICFFLEIKVNGRTGSVTLVALALLALLAAPSGRRADTYVCHGLARRIVEDGSNRRLEQYVQSLLAENPVKATNATTDVTARRPPWLRQLFPERHIMVDLYNGEVRCLRVQIGGPFLRYGCYVGATASEILPIRGDAVTLSVASNIVVYAD